tara:strand:- start:661 stop:909 length:249 start_codon:yes stop_codon:yes gene_type:complete
MTRGRANWRRTHFVPSDEGNQVVIQWFCRKIVSERFGKAVKKFFELFATRTRAIKISLRQRVIGYRMKRTWIELRSKVSLEH